MPNLSALRVQEDKRMDLVGQGCLEGVRHRPPLPVPGWILKFNMPIVSQDGVSTLWHKYGSENSNIR